MVRVVDFFSDDPISNLEVDSFYSVINCLNGRKTNEKEVVDGPFLNSPAFEVYRIGTLRKLNNLDIHFRQHHGRGRDAAVDPVPVRGRLDRGADRLHVGQADRADPAPRRPLL